MAYTSLIPVHRLDNSIHYVLNTDKTEQGLYVTGINCVVETAFEDMIETKKKWHKPGGVQGYHLVQSFAEGEVTPELAHQIGQEFAERLLGNRFEVIVSTHLNTKNYHNHIVWNSVSFADGKKYHSNAKSYITEVRKLSDEICEKYGLSIIHTEKSDRKEYAKWQAEQNGQPTWRTAIRADVEDAIAVTFSWQQFVKELKVQGYEVKEKGQYVSVRPPGKERFVRLKSLGARYTEEAIRERIFYPETTGFKYILSHKRFQRVRYTLKPKSKLSGIRALYYQYLYRMGALRKKPRKISSYLRQDLRKLDRLLEQIDFLQKHKIDTLEELHAYRKPVEEQVQGLVAERQKWYRTEPDSVRIPEINALLKLLRKDVKLCKQIEKQSEQMAEKLKMDRENEVKRKEHEEKRKKHKRER